MAYNQGVLNPYQIASTIPNEVFGIAINWFAPRSPLLSRLPKVPDGSPIFQMIGHSYRPRTTTLGAALADNTNTTVVLTDASFIMQGDILALASGEYVEVTADPTNTTNITVRRGISGTTAAAQSNTTAVTLIGNSRTGGEDMPKAISSQLSTATQYMQTIQHPYSVGGGVQSNTLYPLQPGASTPLEGYKMDAMQNAVDDGEYSAYYGKGEAATNSTASRAKMNGLSSIITTNKVTSPTSASAYKASDFQRDLLTGPRKTGGAPSMVFVASNWMDAFATWSIPLQRIDQGQTVYGRNIRSYSCAFLGDVEIVEASLLPNFTAFSITPEEVRWRVKRPLIDEPYAKSGDVSKGHMLMELAIEVDNEFHHGWLQGVTAFSA